MKKEITISLKDVKTKEDLFHKFYERDLKLQKIERYENNPTYNWDALSDDLCALDYPGDVKELNLIITDWLRFERALPEESSVLLSVLAWSTDPAQRVDGINFTFQLRAEEIV